MPKILAPSLAEHNDQAWETITNALERLLTNTSYDAITMASMASAAGMARNTLYNYASDKPSLVAAVTERAGIGLLQRVAKIAEEPGQPLKRIETITVAIIAWFVEDEHRRRCRERPLCRYFSFIAQPDRGASKSARGPRYTTT